MLIAQLSDSHVRPPGVLFADIVDTAAMLAAAIDAVLAFSPRPDAVLFSGDLTNDGEPEAYAAMAPVLARLPMPAFAIPGNHDNRDAMTALADVVELGAGGRYRHYASDLGELRLVALDSLVPGAAHGALCAERLAWLEAELDGAGDRPLLLMMHHPPGETGIVFMDRIGLRSSPELEVLLRRHADRIQRIVCGHVHRPIFYRWLDIPVSVAPGVAHQVVLGLGGDTAAFVMEPPGFHLHRWTAAGGLVTHHVPIGCYPGPYSFGGNSGVPPIR
jgi:3',5'-cyclic AMP phosphodiesterase CpdA